VTGYIRLLAACPGVCRNSLAGVAVSLWFVETTLAGWVLASSVCA